MNLYWLLFLVIAAQAQTCQPQFLLQSVIQDTFDIINFQNTAESSIAEYNYPYNRNFFNQIPISLLSISGLNVPGFSSLNYLIYTEIKNNTLVISLKSSKMIWKKASIWLLLHSRKDIVREISLITTRPNSYASLTIKSTVNAQNIFYFSNILGIEASPSNNYSIQIEALKISGQTVNIVAYSNTKASITIQTTYFDTAQTQFAYGYQKITSNSLSQFFGVWMQFSPVLYSLVGLNSFYLEENNIQIDLSIDLASNLLQISRSKSFSQLQLGFFSFGQLPSQVCSPCNNFNSITGCLDSCPSGSYPYSFPSGGKTCRSCFSPLGQSLSNNSCTCPENQVYYQGNCYLYHGLPVKCSENQILIGNVCYSKNSSKDCSANSHASPDGSSCLCDDTYEQFQSECFKICPQNSTRTSSGVCGCNYGYIMNASKLCESICPENSQYSQGFQMCRCDYNFQMVNGQCQRCSNGKIYNSATSQCVAAFYSKSGSSSILSVCQTNQIQVNGVCVCDSNSISVNEKCQICPQATYKSQNQCANCSSYCNKCQSALVCNECKAGFNLASQKCSEICGDGRRFSVECDDGNNQNGDGCSSACRVQQGYRCAGGSPISTDVCQKIDPTQKDITISVRDKPRYQSCGIFINFTVNPPIARSEQQLRKMFDYKFTPDKSRPKQIQLKQNQQDPSQIQCFLNYQNNFGLVYGQGHTIKQNFQSYCFI